METIEDIVAEMRKRFEPYAKSDSNDARYVAYLGYAEFADRIEAAHKREQEDAISATVVSAVKSASEVYEPHIQSEPVGNVAAMREALECVRDWLEVHNAYVDTEREIAKLNAALSAPPRNCDIYQKDEVRFAYHLHGDWLMTMQAFADWLFDEAKGEMK